MAFLRKRGIHSLRILLAASIVAVIYFYRLDKPLFWCDEAETGIVARNVLRAGVPVAYDNRNVMIAGKGAPLNASLEYKEIPWAQYYIGAVSIVVFGNSTAGLRLLFATLGLLAYIPIYATLKSRVKWPEMVTALALAAPQVVLFQRNARYYPILILLYSILVWLLSTEFKSARIRFCAATPVLILFFHTHSVAAACCCAALILYCLLFDRRSIVVFGAASVIGFLSWLAWYELLGPPLSGTAMNVSGIGDWFNRFAVGLGAVFVDLDAVGAFPILLWALLVPLSLWRDKNAFKQPIPAFILLNVLVQGIATAAVFGSESRFHFAILRYMPHLVVFSLVSAFVLLNSLISTASLYVLTCAAVMGLNLLTVSFWVHPYSREVPISWVSPVYREIMQPHDTVLDEMVRQFRGRSDAEKEMAIAAFPVWTQ